MYDIYYNFVHISGLVEDVQLIDATNTLLKIKTTAGQSKTEIDILCKDNLAIKASVLTEKNIIDIKGYITDNKIIAKDLYVKEYVVKRKKDKVMLQNRLGELKNLLTFDKVEEWSE